LHTNARALMIIQDQARWNDPSVLITHS